MPKQPVKKSGPFQKPRSKTVRKPSAEETKRKNTKKKEDKRLPPKHKERRKIVRRHPQEYGTSKLEERFAREFLDKIGVEYKYQYKAESIGRYYDFRIMPRGPIIEVQGSYWHGDDRIYEEKDLNATQRRNRVVDEKKRKWCSMNGIKLLYVWEDDINKDPEGVMNFLRAELKDFIGRKKEGRKNGVENGNTRS